MFLTVVLINEMPFLILIEESIQNPHMKIKALIIFCIMRKNTWYWNQIKKSDEG